MGQAGCKTCDCTKQEQMNELELEPNDRSFDDSSTLDIKLAQQTKKAPKQEVSRGSNASKWQVANRHVPAYTRIQAIWKGYISRRGLNVVISNDLVLGTKYFNYWET
jgi:hypothetical protein